MVVCQASSMGYKYLFEELIELSEQGRLNCEWCCGKGFATLSRKVIVVGRGYVNISMQNLYL